MGRDSGSVSSEGSARDRILRIGLATTLVNRGIALLVPLVTLPILLGELGAQRYGVWVTVTSLAAILAVLDLGVGNATLIRLAASRSTDDKMASVITMYRIAGVIALILLVVWTALSVTGVAAQVYGAESVPDAAALIHIATVAAIMQLPLSLIYKVQIGLGRQGGANLAQAFGSVAVLGGLLTASLLDLGALFIVSWAALCPVATATLYTWRCVHKRNLPRSTLRDVRGQSSLQQLRVGLPIFVVSMLMLLSQNVDPYIIGRSLGYEAVQDFAVPFRIFTALSALAVMLSAPLWALNSEALSRGDVGWVSSRTRKVAILGGLFVGTVSLALTASGGWLLEAWLGGAVDFQIEIWLAFGGMASLQAVSGPYFMVQNAVASMWIQICAYAFVVCLIPLKIIVLQEGGLFGLVLTLVAVQLVILLPCAVFGAQRTLKRNEVMSV